MKGKKNILTPASRGVAGKWAFVSSYCLFPPVSWKNPFPALFPLKPSSSDYWNPPPASINAFHFAFFPFVKLTQAKQMQWHDSTRFTGPQKKPQLSFLTCTFRWYHLFFFLKHKSLSVYISVQKANLFSDCLHSVFLLSERFPPLLFLLSLRGHASLGTHNGTTSRPQETL